MSSLCDYMGKHEYLQCRKVSQEVINTLRTGDADLRFYSTTVQGG